ncbi:MAG: DivIVA domain-containing protein [Thermodesulfobacteriota bacterium]
MLTPENIQTQQFHVRFRGFDVDEVDRFLEKVAENYLLLDQENKQMTARLELLQGKQDASQSQEETFKTAIISAQTIANEMKKKSEDEAEEIVRVAQEQATTMVDEASSKVAALEEQISVLAQEKERLKDELRVYLTTLINNLENDGSSLPPQLTGAGQLGEIAEATLPPAAEAASAAPPEPEAADDDLDDLYEKIDIPEDLDILEAAPEEAAEAGVDSGQTAEMGVDLADPEGLDELAADLLSNEPSASIPDLDEDMLFTLEEEARAEPEPSLDVEPLPEKD